MIHELITKWSEKAPDVQLRRVLDVSRSGYYEAKQRKKRDKATSREAVEVAAAFQASGKSYGTRRISAALRKRGIDVGRYRARTLMRQQGLRTRWTRRFITTTDSRHDLAVADNVLDRNFNPDAPNKAWVSDITYVYTTGRWLYLAVVIDLFSRRVVGWTMADRMHARLVCGALQLAIATRQPKPGLIVHSDRGTQYASHDFQNLLKRHGLIPSMSGKGNCWDNAVAERFFLSLKIERVWQRKYATPIEAMHDIANYIVGYYNPDRLHSTLGYRSPIEHERIHAQPIGVSGMA